MEFQVLAGAEAIATDSTGLEWRDLIDDSGNFNLNLYRGNWTLEVSNTAMNVTPITLEVANESIPMVELAANPDNVSVTFRVFLDTNEDGNYSNGTSIAPKFNITAINEFGLSLEVTEDMYDSQTGELTVDLSVGDYRIDMIADDLVMRMLLNIADLQTICRT